VRNNLRFTNLVYSLLEAGKLSTYYQGQIRITQEPKKYRGKPYVFLQQKCQKLHTNITLCVKIAYALFNSYTTIYQLISRFPKYKCDQIFFRTDTNHCLTLPQETPMNPNRSSYATTWPCHRRNTILCKLPQPHLFDTCCWKNTICVRRGRSGPKNTPTIRSSWSSAGMGTACWRVHYAIFISIWCRRISTEPFSLGSSIHSHATSRLRLQCFCDHAVTLATSASPGWNTSPQAFSARCCEKIYRSDPPSRQGH